MCDGWASVHGRSPGFMHPLHDGQNQYISGCDRQNYSQLENDARLKGVGAWSVPGGIERPWDYRRGRRGSGSAFSSGGTSSSGRYRCSEIDPWSKAQDLLRQGHAYLDRDGDGEACESLK